nr:transcriptional regulator [uncultured Oscillibacter sp.]
MGIRYKPLWILLIKRDLTKGREKAEISSRAMAKMGKGEDVNADVPRKIRPALNCALNDLVEITPDKPDNLGGEAG